MATTFSGTISVQLLGTMNKTLDIGTARLDVNYSKRYSISNGTGANQSNMVWTDTRTITASSSDDLDLYGGLTNAFGDTVNFTAIHGIYIFAAAANTNNLLIGGDGSAFVNWVSDASDKVVVKPGGMIGMQDPSEGGYAVTSSSADILQVANSAGGTSVDYDIIIIGEV